MNDEETIRAALVRAKEKLKAYFDETKGSYPGGPPYQEVMKEADAALIALARLVAERDAAEARGWNDAIETAASFVANEADVARASEKHFRERPCRDRRDEDDYERMATEFRLRAQHLDQMAAAIRALRKETQ